MEMGKDKLKRFSEIKTFDNVLQPNVTHDVDHTVKGKWNDKFNNKQPITLELGCGRGEYTVGLAQKFPKKNFIGIDIKGARLWKGAKTAKENNLNNVKFLRTKVDFINHFFSKNEVNEIWLTFSDPQPKKPRKRLTSPLFIERYQNILSKNGIVHLKTDSDLLYEYTIEQIKENNYSTIDNISDIYNEFDSLGKEIKSVIGIKTFYEEKWLEEGKKIKYVSFRIN